MSRTLSERFLNTVNIYLVKVNNRNTRRRCEIYSNLTIKTTERHQLHRSVGFMLTLNIFYTFFWCFFYCFEQINASWENNHINNKIISKYMCCFCKGNHKTYCSITKQRDLPKKSKLCFNFLSSDHIIKQCMQKFSCKVSGYGKRRHNRGKGIVTSKKLDMDTSTSIYCHSSNQAVSVNKHSAFSNNENITNLLQIAPVVVNPLDANHTKWSNKLKQFVGSQQPTNCLSVFDHFVGMALKGLRKHQ